MLLGLVSVLYDREEELDERQGEVQMDLLTGREKAACCTGSLACQLRRASLLCVRWCWLHEAGGMAREEVGWEVTRSDDTLGWNFLEV